MANRYEVEAIEASSCGHDPFTRTALGPKEAECDEGPPAKNSVSAVSTYVCDARTAILSHVALFSVNLRN